MFSVAKAKRQLQMFSVAKAKRQLQMFSVRKRSVSNKCFLCESEASATKRPVGTEINHTLW
ncbi:hypothetical protein [Lysinibacillus sp. G4S2]|uniref:hypothetical protein n=1 Tax=Lysinibacillus sp. G4S2 TaxID=3055859 RepID=UPI0025A2EE2A|nr:hypothetical protein [Lysinibacillus sp. G4S2]MDM5246156.1 hypothetical protein [Lysinibacillus sp. G4S2]